MAVARAQGVVEILPSGMSADAGIMRLPQGYVIRVNERHSAARQRFSCAHEIGHTLLFELDGTAPPGDEQVSGESQRHPAAVEHLCDVIASELLMPEAAFRQAIAGGAASIAAIVNLAERLQLSLHAVARRYVECSSGLALIVWQRPRSKASGTGGLQVAWSLASPEAGPTAAPQAPSPFPLPGGEGNDVEPAPRWHRARIQEVELAVRSGNLVAGDIDWELGALRGRFFSESRAFGASPKSAFVLTLVHLTPPPRHRRGARQERLFPGLEAG